MDYGGGGPFLSFSPAHAKSFTSSRNLRTWVSQKKISAYVVCACIIMQYCNQSRLNSNQAVSAVFLFLETPPLARPHDKRLTESHSSLANLASFPSGGSFFQAYSSFVSTAQKGLPLFPIPSSADRLWISSPFRNGGIRGGW